MVKRYFCDYCGKEVDRENYYLLWVEIDNDDGTYDTVDELGAFCPDCLDKVDRFLEELKKQKGSVGAK